MESKMPEGSSYLHLDVLLFSGERTDSALATGRFMGAMSFPIAPREWTHSVVNDTRTLLATEMPEAIANMADGTLFVVPKPPHPNSYPLLFILENKRLV